MTELGEEFKAFVKMRFAWFLAGLFVAGNDIPAIIASIRTFVGV